LHILPVLRRGQHERHQPDEDHQQGEHTGAEKAMGRGKFSLFVQKLKELVDGETEADERRGRPDPGHQRPLIGEARTFCCKLCRVKGGNCALCIVVRHGNPPYFYFLLVLSPTAFTPARHCEPRMPPCCQHDRLRPPPVTTAKASAPQSRPRVTTPRRCGSAPAVPR